MSISVRAAKDEDALDLRRLSEADKFSYVNPSNPIHYFVAVNGNQIVGCLAHADPESLGSDIGASGSDAQMLLHLRIASEEDIAAVRAMLIHVLGQLQSEYYQMVFMKDREAHPHQDIVKQLLAEEIEQPSGKVFCVMY